MRVFATLFDVRYLTRALALHDSLSKHDADAELWALCLDDAAVAALERLKLPHIRIVALATLEAADPELLAVKPTRTHAEYCFTLTPAWTIYVLEHAPADTWVSYVDADIRFYSSPQPIFDELASASVGITPHRFPAHNIRMERFGRFNVGLVPFRNDIAGLEVARDWRAQCLEWCSHVPDGKRFADQKYLDAWQDRFPQVSVISNAAAGLGPWNWMTAQVDAGTVPPSVNGSPLIYYHFHGFRLTGDTSYDAGFARYGTMPSAMRRSIYDPYARELKRNERRSGVAPERHPVWVFPRSFALLRRMARLLAQTVRRASPIFSYEPERQIPGSR